LSRRPLHSGPCVDVVARGARVRLVVVALSTRIHPWPLFLPVNAGCDLAHIARVESGRTATPSLSRPPLQLPWTRLGSNRFAPHAKCRLEHRRLHSRARPSLRSCSDKPGLTSWLLSRARGSFGEVERSDINTVSARSTPPCSASVMPYSVILDVRSAVAFARATSSSASVSSAF